MWRRRLTVFRDAPDLDLLKELSVANWRLFRFTPGNVYFLNDDDPSNPSPILGSHYDSLIRVNKVACPEFEAFLEANPGKLDKYSVHKEILHEALSLSDVFQTLVLSYYGDDESSDFVAIAENGVLKRLRVRKYVEKIRTLSDDEARAVDTEIHARNIGQNALDDDACDVSEYLVLELLKTEGREMRFEPYGRFVEGEIGRQVIFKELWQSPADTPFNLIFRNAHLELEHVFGFQLPDYIDDIADDFELVARHQISAAQGWSQTFASLGGWLRKNSFKLVKSHPIISVMVLIILAGAIFGRDDTDRDDGPPTFDSACREASGEPVVDSARNTMSPGYGERCVIDGLAYPDHLIPASAGDERVIAVHYRYVACSSDMTSSCFALEGEEFFGEIEGFEPVPNERGVALIYRTTLCDPTAPGICLSGSPAFRYRLQRKFSVSPEGGAH